MMDMDIAENIKVVKDKIYEAALRSNRHPEDITLIAVTKTVDEDRIMEALCAGIRDIGENRVQEIVHKYPAIERKAKWHLIGSLQRNKVKYIIDKVDLIHSLDRLSLAEELEKRAAGINRLVPVLIQVNVSKEETKQGIDEKDLFPFIDRVSKFSHIKIEGLMTIAPFVQNKEQARPVFARLYELFHEIAEGNFPNVEMKYLSMGMTNDFEVAIEEGANMVRIGRAIFGERR